MRIFVGFGFNPRDQWIKDLVFPLIEAFDAEVVSGEEIHGQQITDAVRQKIDSCTALLGFTTRRDSMGDGRWTTHRWVTDEISHALGKIPLVEVREVGVDDQGGIVGDRQRITYEENKRDACLVELARVLGRWRRELNPIRLQLLPPEYVKDLIGIHRRPELKCQYRLLKDGEEQGPFPVTLRPITGGLFLELKRVDLDALIQVEIEYKNRTWISGFESVDAIGVMLQQG